MLNQLFLEEDKRILEATKRNQEIHMQSVEEVERKKPYEPPRFPHPFNPGYSPKNSSP